MPDEQTNPVGPGAGSTMAQSPMEIMQKGLEEAAANAPADDAEAIWDALGDEAKQIREGKKWSQPSDLVKAYKEATTRLSQRDEEKEALMAELARYENQPAAQQPQAQPGAQQPAPLNFDALAASLVDPETGEMQHARMMEMAVALGARMAYDAAEARMEERFTQFRQEHVTPLAERDAQAQMAAEMEAIEAAYGTDLYRQLEGRVEEKLKEDSHYLDGFKSLKGAFADVMFEHQRDQAAEAAAGAEAHTIRGSSRRPQAPAQTREQQEVALMDSHRWRPSDGL